MSKSTETTNDRVPRVLVRFGKHHQVYGNTIKCMETPINCGETLIERVETPINCGETWGCTEALPKGGRGVRDSRNERTRGGGGLDAGS